MDPLFDRLGRLIRSFGLENDRPRPTPLSQADQDLREAEAELEAFLRGGEAQPQPRPQTRRQQEPPRRPQPAPETEVTRAFQVLGLAESASWEQINTAHRRLLKEAHPDRHAGDEQKMRQATERSQKINQAFQVLKKHLGRS